MTLAKWATWGDSKKSIKWGGLLKRGVIIRRKEMEILKRKIIFQIKKILLH